MPTKKKRINITPSEQLYILIEQLADADNVPLSEKTIELLEMAVELSEEEDKWLSAIADRRAKEDAEYVSHEEAWSWDLQSNIIRGS